MVRIGGRVSFPVFQCPYGHSLFFHSVGADGPAEARKGFNALTGILCFSTGMLFGNSWLIHRDELFQCPYGHSLFFHFSPHVWGLCGGQKVSMPLRAFFVFPPAVMLSLIGGASGLFQCPYGHSLFFHAGKS